MPSKNPFLPTGVRPPTHYVPAIIGVGVTVRPLEGDIVYRFAGDQLLAGSGTFMADIDGSNTRELAFEYRWEEEGGTTYLALVVSPQGGSRLLSTDEGAPVQVAPGAAIGASPTDGGWTDAALLLARRPTISGNPGPWSGPWVGVTRGYVGLEMATEDGPRYAWVRLSVHGTTGHLTVHGYAFRVSSSEDIPAGVEA